MVTSGSFNEQTVTEARSLIESGISESAVITQYRIKWGLSLSDAERLFREAKRDSSTPGRAAMREEGTSDLLWGFGALAVGGVITAVTWISADPGSSYFLFWGPMIYGGYRLVKGFVLKFRTSTNTAAVFTWLAVALLMGGGIAIAGTLAFTAGQIEDPKESEFVWLDDEPVLVSDDVVRFSGRIQNDNDTWSIENPKLTIHMYNEAGLLVGSRTAELNLVSVEPNESRRYSTDMSLRENFETYEPEMVWEWVVD